MSDELVGKSVYGERLKLFGEEAERIQRDEFDQVTQEVIARAADQFTALKVTRQLSDKGSFGDVDLIALPKTQLSRELLADTFGEDLLNYHRNGGTYSTLLKLSTGKQVHVDFIHATDAEDLERKYTYYSNGHASSIIGMMAKKLGYKYGTEGFFKRYQDSRGQWHDVKISESLDEGMKILGLNPQDFWALEKVEDVVAFVSHSPFFRSSFFDEGNLARADKESVRRVPVQAYLVQTLRDKQIHQDYDPENAFRTSFPTKFEEYKKQTD